jgi:hypothetical protein
MKKLIYSTIIITFAMNKTSFVILSVLVLAFAFTGIAVVAENAHAQAAQTNTQGNNNFNNQQQTSDFNRGGVFAFGS